MIRLLIVEPDTAFAHKVADEARRLNYVPVLLDSPAQAADLLLADDPFDVVLLCGDIDAAVLHQIVRSAFAQDLLTEVIVTGLNLEVEPVVALMRMGVSNVLVRRGELLSQVESTVTALRDSVRSREQDAESLRRIASPG